VTVVEQAGPAESSYPTKWFKIRYESTVGWVQGLAIFILADHGYSKRLATTIAKTKKGDLSASYDSQYSELSPALRLLADGGCVFLICRKNLFVVLLGTYRVGPGSIYLYDLVSPNEPDRVSKEIYSSIILEMKATGIAELTLQNEIGYDNGYEHYRFCGPGKGTVFEKVAP
jgi:hypothetical protein